MACVQGVSPGDILWIDQGLSRIFLGPSRTGARTLQDVAPRHQASHRGVSRSFSGPENGSPAFFAAMANRAGSPEGSERGQKPEAIQQTSWREGQTALLSPRPPRALTRMCAERGGAAPTSLQDKQFLVERTLNRPPGSGGAVGPPRVCSSSSSPCAGWCRSSPGCEVSSRGPVLARCAPMRRVWV